MEEGRVEGVCDLVSIDICEYGFPDFLFLRVTYLVRAL